MNFLRLKIDERKRKVKRKSYFYCMLRILVLLLLLSPSVTAQHLTRSLVSASGNSASSSSIFVQQSIGEPVISRSIQSNGTVIQQGFHHSSASAVRIDDSFEALIYPNPGNGLVSFSTSEGPEKSYSIILSDLNGKIIHQNQYTTSQHIDLQTVNSGMYFFIISNGSYSVTLPYSKIH